MLLLLLLILLHDRKQWKHETCDFISMWCTSTRKIFCTTRSWRLTALTLYKIRDFWWRQTNSPTWSHLMTCMVRCAPSVFLRFSWDHTKPEAPYFPLFDSTSRVLKLSTSVRRGSWKSSAPLYVLWMFQKICPTIFFEKLLKVIVIWFR